MISRIIGQSRTIWSMLLLAIALLAIPEIVAAQTVNPDDDVGCAVFRDESPPAPIADHPQLYLNGLSSWTAADLLYLLTGSHPVAEQPDPYRSMSVHDMVKLTADKLVMDTSRPGHFDARLESVRLLT